MANRPTHDLFGGITGMGCAYLTLPTEPQSNGIVELVGGAVGGVAGSRIPDIIDPATMPNHRDVGHGIINAIVVGNFCWSNLSEWQAWCRARADECAACRARATDDVARALYWIAEIFWRFVAGLLAGLIGGYASHLVLDATTPRSLPLFCREC